MKSEDSDNRPSGRQVRLPVHRGETGRTPGRWSSRLVRLATVAGVISTLVLLGGFGYGTYAALGGSVAGFQTPISPASTGNTAQSPTVAGHSVHVVGLGDSLTHGLGDSTGQGYVGDVSAQYRSQGYQVIQSNLGIDGLTSKGLLTELNQPGVRDLVQSANVILISIGGNDLNDAAGLPNLDAKRISTAESQFENNITSFLTELRQLNTTATIALVGLYNPYSNVTSSARQIDAIVQAWDLQEDKIAAEFTNTVVVQTFDLFQLHPNKFLYADHFHPNQLGYERIATRVWQDIQA